MLLRSHQSCGLHFNSNRHCHLFKSVDSVRVMMMPKRNKWATRNKTFRQPRDTEGCRACLRPTEPMSRKGWRYPRPPGDSSCSAGSAGKAQIQVTWPCHACTATWFQPQQQQPNRQEGTRLWQMTRRNVCKGLSCLSLIFIQVACCVMAS